MAPILGQGTGCAIEDAAILVRTFEFESDIAAALARYSRARAGRCAFVRAKSNANAHRIQGDEAEIYGMTKPRNEETLGLIAYDTTTVTI